MKDRFRFRAWNLEKGIMHYDVEDTYDGISNNAIEHSNFSAVLEDDEYVVMQSTGLKDKNGKLIYEGDILFNDSVEESNCYAVVKWDCQLAKFYLDDGENYLEIDGDGFDKVIGNIYENKELLKEQK